jgi:hypothetical protein
LKIKALKKVPFQEKYSKKSTVLGLLGLVAEVSTSTAGFEV